MIKKLMMIISFAAIGYGFILGDSLRVYAQEEFTLEEITVTAQKREEEAQKVGIAMEVFDGEDLSETGRNDLDQILSLMSSAFVSRTNEGLRVSLRGVAFDTPAGFGDGALNDPGTVAVNLDGVFSGKRPTGTGLYDMERVEVLIGPQSTMYASNAPGGIVNILMTKPQMDKYEASGILEYGNYNFLHTEGSVNAPISNTMAMRASFTTNVRDGYLSNGSENEDSKSARLRALYAPNDKFSILFTGQYDVSDSYGMSSVTAFKTQDDVPDPWYTEQTLTSSPSNTNLTKFYAEIEYDFGFGILTIVPANFDDTYYRTSSRTDPSGITSTGISDGWGYEKEIEVRMASSSDSRIQWITGFNWYKQENYRKSTTEYPDGRIYRTDYEQLEKLMAVLGNITYPVMDQIRLIGGIRYSKDRFMMYRHMIVAPPGQVSTLSDMTYKAPDYKLGIEYDLSDSALLFANWGTSYRVQGQSYDWRGNIYPTQKNVAYTAGLKSRFFGNKLQVNASAFHYTYTDRIFVAMEMAYIDPNADPVVVLPTDAPGGVWIPDEGAMRPGDLRMYGADIDTSWIITPSDKLDLSVSYLDSWVTDLFYDYQYVEDRDYSNRTPTFSPKWTISLNYSHNFNLPNDGILTARFDSRYQSDYLVDWRDTSPGRGGEPPIDMHGYRDQEAHHVDNFALVYAHPGGKWTFSGYIKNLWNYAEKRFINQGLNLHLGPPRTFGAVLSIRY